VNFELPGLHEQDDDRINILITNSTGVTNYITIYIIAGLVGLMVMTLGIVFIKKKVLIK
jgi:LPXTG-motif cell wall-anchored protein